MEKGHVALQRRRIKVVRREEVEIDGLAMPKLERYRRAAIQHEGARHLTELIPQSALRGGKDFQMREGHEDILAARVAGLLFAVRSAAYTRGYDEARGC